MFFNKSLGEVAESTSPIYEPELGLYYAVTRF